MSKGILSINQDPLGQAATPFQPAGAAAPNSRQLSPYWAGMLSDGVVIGLVAVNGAATLSVNLSDVPGLGPGSWKWTEVYSGTSGTGASVSATLGSHDMAVYKVTTAS
jgi:alpha-galactosidase